MNKQKSFTLIELLVVIVIIGVLAGVIMISTSSSIDKANIAKLKVFEESVQNNLAAHMVSAWDADHVTKGVTWVLNDKWGNNNGTFYDNTSTACTTSLCPQIVADNQMGNVLSFDGVYDYVLASSVNFLTYSGEYTFSAWIYSKNNYPIHHATIFQNSLNSSDRNGMTIAGAAVRFGYFDALSWKGKSGNISENKWYYVTGTNQNGSIKLYIDGIEKFDGGNPYVHNRAGFFIGKNSYDESTNGPNLYMGLINNIKIYNAALSSSQIKQNYIAGLDSLLSDGNISKEDYNQRISELTYEK